LTLHQNEISGLQTKKYMLPFMDRINSLNHMFNNLYETIKKWTKVQSLWTALEPVFSSEDIRKQLPQEASKFKNLDKDFVKNMTLAKDIK
jgi:dynein heavy chain